VQEASRDLGMGDIKSFGKKMYETHEGLSKLYEVSCKELDFLVGHAKKFESVLGARMMGGGFGGCTINIVKDADVESFIDMAKKAYHKNFNIELLPYVVAVKDGTGVVDAEKFSMV
jgi:galactokinase